MTDLIRAILNRDFVSADSLLEEKAQVIVSIKLEEAKKSCAAKMMEQGLCKTAAELTRMGVVEEEELDEVNLSREKPDTSDIEDLRPVQKPDQSGKASLPANQSQTVASGKGDMPKPQTVNRAAKGNLKEEDEEQLDEARIRIVKARIRGGKIQRRKKVSNVPGMTLRGGKLKRMSPAERRHRKMGQRKGKMKRRAKMSRALMKRQRSLRKRKALGL